NSTGIYEVTAVKAGNKTVLTVTPAPKADSTKGQVVLVHPLTDAKANQFASKSANPASRDLLKFSDADGVLRGESKVVTAADGSVKVKELPDDARWFSINRRSPRMSVPLALGLVVVVSLCLGLAHGLLVSQLRLQPFVVTLCGLLLYRGITRGLVGSDTVGLGDEYEALRQIVTFRVFSLTHAELLWAIGGGLFATSAGWLGYTTLRKGWEKAKPQALVPGVGAAFGLATLIGGIFVHNHQPTLPVPMEGDIQQVEVPSRVTSINLEAQSGGSWSVLEKMTLEESNRPTPIDVPVAKIQKMGAYTAVRILVTGQPPEKIYIQSVAFIFLAVVLVAAIFLNQTIYGRYLLALGNNEQAAKFSGINTSRMIVLAYVICTMLAGLGGMLFILDVNSAQASDFGNFYELWAIAAAVLGGCSLRGGTGSILGIVIGVALMRVLENMIIQVDWISDHIRYAVVGAVILAGVIADEVFKRQAAKRADAKQAEE
ncbi:MAG: hypothetical protein CMO66_06825, partial [Verrucomicrobiales bacterium]|nr:hypothetical protein [Verrucomicrobiales bacterium]